MNPLPNGGGDFLLQEGYIPSVRCLLTCNNNSDCESLHFN
jgi:hypothetical protein